MRSDKLTSDLVSWRILPGVSGASVILGTTNGHQWFVRKVASTSESSARLRDQAHKQRRFASEHDTSISTPDVLDEGVIDDCYFFEMPMVAGVDGATFLRRASYIEVVGFADRLMAYFRDMSAASPFEVTESSLFESLSTKLRDVQATTGALSATAAQRLSGALDGIRQLGEVAATWCHGDLTLENMLVSPEGQIWVVDLLDAPYEHYWQDVAKLHQDLDGGWYLRRGAPIAAGVLEYLSRRLQSGAIELDPKYRVVHGPLVAMTFVRILPYVTGADADFVRERIEHYASTIDLGELS